MSELKELITRAKQKVEQGIDVKQERPMHHGVVFIALPGVELPGIERVQALVVALRARAQVGKHGGDRQNAQEDIEQHLQVEVDGPQDRRVQQVRRTVVTG